MKILAIGASSSKASINKQFASFTANQVEGAEINTLDLNDYEMAIYSSDREKATGIPAEATKFRSQIEEADGIVISFAEHNGTYSAAFKNIFDWVSRTEGKTWGDKPMLVLATSPGARGGLTVMNQAATTLPYQGALVTSKFSLPSFYQSFSNEEGIKDAELKADFDLQLEAFKSKLVNYAA
jgi:chromate reductase, NAD(P)H dehydrogenase (quinone)